MNRAMNVVWLLLAAGLAACAGPEPIETPTQVLLQIVAADAALAGRVSQLEVQASRGPERAPSQVTIDMRGRRFPVDVPILPRHRDDRVEKFEVLVEARADQQVLAQARVTTSFQPGQHRTLTIALFGCPNHPTGFVCSDRSCRGPECTVCNPRGECVPVPEVDALTPTQGNGLDGGFSEEANAPGDDATVRIDADSSAVSALDGGRHTSPPAPLSDATPACTPGSCGAGYACTAGACVSACEQTRCDPNATCMLQDGQPVCSCHSGYVAALSAGSVTCTRDKACEELACGPNTICEVGGDGLRHCVCKVGFTQSGSDCVAVSCPALTLTNGSVSSDRTFGAVAEHTCKTGYRLIGVSRRSCQSSGQWSDSPPACELVDCGSAPTAPTGGTVTATGTSFGAEATYKCGAAYAISGTSRLTCLASGLWSGPAPSCQRLCGNGKRDNGEACDPGIASEQGWCSDDCVWAKVPYGACSSPANCPAGFSCVLGYCSQPCSDDALKCPLPPVLSSAVWCGQVVGATTYCSMTSCNPGGGGAACAPGLVCVFDSTWVCRGP